MDSEPVDIGIAVTAADDGDLREWRIDQLDWLWPIMLRGQRASANPDMFDADTCRNLVERHQLHRIPWAGLLALVAETATTYGAHRAIRLLEECLGQPKDEILDEADFARLWSCDADGVFLLYVARRFAQRVPPFGGADVEHWHARAAAWLDRYVQEYHSDVAGNILGHLRADW